MIEAAGRPPRVVDTESPVPGEGRVAVRVAAAPITPLDLLCATGTSYFGCPALPYVPGVQGVGTLRGAPVWFATSAGMAPGDGSMRAVADVPLADVVELPDGADPVLVAALGLSAVAAWCAMTATGGLGAGETVLVLGAGGVVGQAAVQLARRAGAGRVIAAARAGQARERALSLGADAVVDLGVADGGAAPDGGAGTAPGGGSPAGGPVAPPDSSGAGTAPSPTAAPGPLPPGPGAAPTAGPAEPSAGPEQDQAAHVAVLTERMREACAGPVDLVLDPLCGPPAAAALRTLRPRGRLVNLGGSAGPSMPVESALMRSGELRILGYSNNALTPEHRRAALTVVVEEVLAGRLTTVHEAVPLADAAAAWTRTGGGRVVLVPSGGPTPSGPIDTVPGGHR
ncbi:MAG: zinc-binding alcohol dehydrogenase family protein [Pseudonocardia sp.]